MSQTINTKRIRIGGRRMKENDKLEYKQLYESRKSWIENCHINSTKVEIIKRITKLVCSDISKQKLDKIFSITQDLENLGILTTDEDFSKLYLQRRTKE